MTEARRLTAFANPNDSAELQKAENLLGDLTGVASARIVADPDGNMASALGVWGMVILIVTITGASLALGKRLGALFRV